MNSVCLLFSTTSARNIFLPINIHRVTLKMPAEKHVGLSSVHPCWRILTKTGRRRQNLTPFRNTDRVRSAALDRADRQRRSHEKNRTFNCERHNNENPCTVTPVYGMFHSHTKTCPTDRSGRNYVKLAVTHFGLKKYMRRTKCLSN